jgi:phage tail-like protein
MTPSLAIDDLLGPALGHRFLVTFLVGGAFPNPIDIRFSKVSGLSHTVTTEPLKEGGQNLYTHRLPGRVDYGNLTLERGMVSVSPLLLEFNAAMSLFKFFPSNVIVALLSEKKAPIAAWLFFKAYPVKWSTSDLDATKEELLIDSLELAYTSMQVMRI